MIGLRERFDAVFALDPSAIAMEQEGKTYSFEQIARLADALDAIARWAGFDSDAPVGVLLRNRPTLFAAAIATVWRGHCLITINPLLPPAPLRADVVSLAAPILIADEEDWGMAHLREAAEQVGALCLAVNADGLALRPVEGLGRIRGDKHRGPTPGVAVEMLTSGTTGAPKRIQLQRRNLERSLWTGAKYEAGNSGELALKRSAALQWMPLVHVAGLFNALYSIYNGRRVLLMERFDLDRWRDLIVEHRPRFANIPPSYLRALLERGFAKDDFSSLMVLRTGAAPLDHDLALEFERRYGVPVIEAYGATEFAGGVAGWTLKDYKQFGAEKRKSVGRANEGVELRIVDRDSFAPLPVETIGLLEVRTKQMGEGKDWIRTTDLASLDADGFLYIHGRADSAIVRGGFKVHPAQVEKALAEHPDIRAACVVGVPDARVGQAPAAAIELRVGATPPSQEALGRFLRGYLKPYEIPVDFLFVPELPKTPSLKVSQAAVRELFAGRSVA